MDIDDSIIWLKIFQTKLCESINKKELYFKVSLLNGIELDEAIDCILDYIDSDERRKY